MMYTINRWIFAAGLVGCLAITGESEAVPIYRVLGNFSPETAQNVDAYFSLEFNADIGAVSPDDGVQYGPNTSTTIPHVSILSPLSSVPRPEWRPDSTADFYTFTVPTGGSRVILDVDYSGPVPFPCPEYYLDCDTQTGGIDFAIGLARLDGTGVLIANDDSPLTDGAGGSFFFGDPFLELDLSSGEYLLRISSVFFDVLTPERARYALHISVSGHPVPEPSSLALVLLALSAGGLTHYRKRRSPASACQQRQV